MKKQIKKNINQRISFQNFEKKRLILKIISKNLYIKKNQRWLIQQKFLQFKNKTSVTQIKNRCILTGRSRSIYRNFKISRIQLRNLTANGLLPGVSKKIW